MNFIAYLFTILKNMIYGSTVYFTGNLTESVDVLDVLALRFLMSFVALWILKITKIIRINVNLIDFFKKKERPKYIGALFLTALFEPVLYMLFETLGISMTTDITSGVILSLSPIFACLAEGIILKEKTTYLQKIFLGLGIVGASYIAINANTSSGEDTVIGIVFLLLAVITGTLYSVFSRKSSAVYSAMERTYISCVFGFLSFNLANMMRHVYRGDIVHYFEPYFSAENMMGFVFLAIVSTIIATGMNNFALRRLQVSTMSAFGGISTLVTVFIGVVVRDERIETFHALCDLFV